MYKQIQKSTIIQCFIVANKSPFERNPFIRIVSAGIIQFCQRKTEKNAMKDVANPMAHDNAKMHNQNHGLFNFLNSFISLHNMD